MPNSTGRLCRHTGQEVCIGPHRIRAGALMDMELKDFYGTDIVVVLTEGHPPTDRLPLEPSTRVLAFPIRDFDGAKGPWKKLLRGIIAALEHNEHVLICCEGGHGRTGMLLASLMAIREQELDPIATVRERYCVFAVETIEQAQTVFGVAGKTVPIRYRRSLPNRKSLSRAS